MPVNPQKQPLQGIKTIKTGNQSIEGPKRF